MARYAIWVTVGILGLLLVTWLVLLIYVNANEKQLIGKIAGVVAKRTHGEVKIKDLSVSFFRTFPIVSLQLKEVVIRDSLYPLHELELLNASDVYLRASLRGLITRQMPVGKVVIRNAAVNLYTDSLGNSSNYVLKSQNRQKSDEPFHMPDLEFQHVAVNFRNVQRKKHYQAIFRTLHCSPSKKGERLEFALNMKMAVKKLAFNTKAGSYLRDKPVSGRFRLTYSIPDSRLLIHQVRLVIQNHPYVFNGFFSLDKSRSDFKLHIAVNDVLYSDATSILTERLQKKMNQYSIKEPVDLQVTVSGQTSTKSQPLVQASIDVRNSRVGTPLGEFDKSSFKGTFTNESVRGKGITDENSRIHLTGFSGTWEHILIKSKNIRISNLIRPFLDCDVAADVDLKSLNSLAASNSFHFQEGKCAVDVVFKGPLLGTDTAAANINGEIAIYNASVKYLPRNFTLSDCEGKLKFVNNNLDVSELRANTGKTKLVMKGAANNFLSLMDATPGKLFLTWNISSPAIHLEDFRPFLSKAAAKKVEETRKSRLGQTASKIDRLFREGDMFISLTTPSMDYKTFRATDVQANVVLKTTEIAFEKVELKHAGGSMVVSGSLTNGDNANPVTLRTEMKNMDVPTLFAAFENFGQDAVTHQNLSGKLSADVRFRTAVDNQAKLISSANEGIVSFLLENGELNNFEPLIEISRKAFKKQDFTRIRFADLKNSLEIRGTAFIINHMDIRSTALNLSVEGVYDLKKGTDMSIKLPLSNLTKSQADTDISDNGEAKKGLSLRLRARTGDDGKLKVSWDPFRRSKKKKEELQESASEEKVLMR